MSATDAKKGLMEKPSHLEDDEHKAWDFKATISYCVVCCTVEGSILFTIGSFMCYPHELPEGDGLEWLYQAWVDWPFLIGGLFFTFGNYLCYLQVINKDHTHEKGANTKFRFFSCPGRGHGGETASFLNFVGALFFNIGTFSFLGWPTMEGDFWFDFWYVGTGVSGSLCFTVASVIAGQYNKWTSCKPHAVVVMAWMNFLGSVGFLVGYALAFKRPSDHFSFASEYEWVEVWLVTTPFFVGSAFYGVAAYMELYLWKEERFGLGFETDLAKTAKVQTVEKKEESPSWTQMALILVFFGNICIAWIRVFFKAADPHYQLTGVVFGATEKILTYHCLLFLMSVLHKIPKQHPYDYLVHFMRFIAVWGLVGEATALWGAMQRHSGEPVHGAEPTLFMH